MILTSQYRLVRAVFEPSSTAEITSVPRTSDNSSYLFQVGNLTYEVIFYSSDTHGIYGVEFRARHFNGTTEEKIRFLEKAHGESINEILGEEYREFEIDRAVRSFLSSKAYDIIGSGNSASVFSHVVTVIDRFIEARDPEVLQFSASEPSRKRLYSKVIERYKKKGLVLDVTSKEMSWSTKFIVRLKEPEPVEPDVEQTLQNIL